MPPNSSGLAPFAEDAIGEREVRDGLWCDGDIGGRDRGSATNLKMLVFRPAAHEVNGLMFSTGLALGGSGRACHDGEAAAEVSDESPALWAGGELAGWLQTHVNTSFGTKSSHQGFPGF